MAVITCARFIALDAGKPVIEQRTRRAWLNSVLNIKLLTSSNFSCNQDELVLSCMKKVKIMMLTFLDQVLPGRGYTTMPDHFDPQYAISSLSIMLSPYWKSKIDCKLQETKFQLCLDYIHFTVAILAWEQIFSLDGWQFGLTICWWKYSTPAVFSKYWVSGSFRRIAFQ